MQMKIAALIALMASMSTQAQQTPVQTYSLEALQGPWWSDCEAPAAEFLIEGSEYSGDFEGSYRITLAGDRLVFEDGLADGHSINVTHMPLAFQIVQLTDAELVLRATPEAPSGRDDWHLKSCNDVP